MTNNIIAKTTQTKSYTDACEFILSKKELNEHQTSLINELLDYTPLDNHNNFDVSINKFKNFVEENPYILFEIIKNPDCLGMHIIDQLIDFIPNVKIRYHDGSTLLHFIAYYCDVNLFKKLIDKGMDLKATDKNSFSVLDVVFLNRANHEVDKVIKAAELLITNGAKFSKDYFKEFAEYYYDHCIESDPEENKIYYDNLKKFEPELLEIRVNHIKNKYDFKNSSRSTSDLQR